MGGPEDMSLFLPKITAAHWDVGQGTPRPRCRHGAPAMHLLQTNRQQGPDPVGCGGAAVCGPQGHSSPGRWGLAPGRSR